MTDKKQKKLVLRVVLAVATLISLWFVPWPLVTAWLKPLPETVQEQVDNAIDLGFDGIIVYVDRGGREPEYYAAGWNDRANEVPANPHLLFKIASINKLYDAVALTKLVHDGRLSLDESLSAYLPELAERIENADSITLRMLVKHRSGIPNFTNHPGFWSDPPETRQETLELVLDQPANFEPGEGYEYSNTNYLLLAEIIERELGYDKFRYIKENVLDPLDLDNTYSSIDEINMENLMSGYYEGVEEDIKTTDYGSMVATAEDVGVFLRALNDGSVFEGGEEEIYESIYEYDHTGLIPGYQSIAKYHREIDTVIVQFVNTTDFEGYTWSLSEIVYNRIVSIVERQNL